MSLTNMPQPSWAQPSVRTVLDLATGAMNGRIALPDFQRSFVWDVGDTASLISSILVGYPAGTILMLDQDSNDEGAFKMRPVEGAPAQLSPAPQLVLDGQQRITALVQSLAGLGDHVIYISLPILLEADQGEVDIESAVFYRSNRAKVKKKRPLNEAEQLAQGAIPLSLLPNDEERTRWLIAYSDQESTLTPLQTVLTLASKYLVPFLGYTFPVITLPSETGIDAVCKIFETMNVRGVRLSVFELLTARFWPNGVDLRALWERAQLDYPILGEDEFSVDPYTLLQAACVRATHARTPANQPARASAQRSDVMKLSAAEFDAYWPSVVRGASETLEMLRSACGVVSAKWMPYSLLLVPMAAAWHIVDDQVGAKKAAARSKIERFFWASVFMRNYDNGGNSQAGRDFTDLARWLTDSAASPPEAVRDFAFDIDSLVLTPVRQKAIYSGCIALTLRHAKDFHSGASIDASLMADKKIESHHIFPKAWVRDHGPKDADSELIVNRALIDTKTNKTIGASAPSAYIGEIERDFGATPSLLAKVFESQLIDKTAAEALRRDDYEAFASARAQSFVNEINRVVSGT